LIKSFDTLKPNMTFFAPFVVSLSNHIRLIGK